MRSSTAPTRVSRLRSRQAIIRRVLRPVFPPIAGWPVLIKKVGTLRIGVDYAHLTAYHIEKLRQVIDAGVTEKPSQSGTARVGSHNPERSVVRVASIDSAAELQRNKAATPEADAFMPAKHGTWAITFDRKCHNRHKRRCNDDERGSSPEIR
jgi:hypothetical protein